MFLLTAMGVLAPESSYGKQNINLCMISLTRLNTYKTSLTSVNFKFSSETICLLLKYCFVKLSHSVNSDKKNRNIINYKKGKKLLKFPGIYFRSFINTSEIFLVLMSAKSHSNISPNPSKVESQ